MEQKRSRQTIVYCVLAVVLFVALFAGTFRGFSAEKSAEQPEIVAFGDSVLGLFRDETSVTALLQEELETTVFNAGFGGSCMAARSDDFKLSYPLNSLSMVGLSKAIVSDDFGVQRALRYRESNMEYFPEVVNGLGTIDFTRVSTVLIQHGFNDYHAGTTIENPGDLYDEYTYTGALRSSVRRLRRVNPDLRIVLVTPTYSWYVQTGLTCEEADYGGGILEDYVEALLRVGQELGAEVIDLYHDFYPHENWEDKDLYTLDGAHPNEAGRAMMAKRIGEVLSFHAE